jgi:LysR family hca operon transcriptional activator
MELRCQRGEIKHTKAVRDRLDRRRPSQAAVAPQEVINETFYLPSKAAPAARRVVLEYFNRAGIDLKPEHEVHDVVQAISMITSTRAIMLLPDYTNSTCPRQ